MRGPLLGLTAGFETDEPLEFGVLPAHLIEGLLAPLWDYRTQPNEGGSLLWGLWVAPFFAVAGPSYLALRVAGLAWHAATMLTFCALARRAAGERAAWVCGALWIAAPPGIVWLASRGWANHLEATLLVGLALLGATGQGRRAAVLAGAALPLAAFFQLSAAAQAAAAGVVAVVAVARGRLPWRWFGLGVLIGGAPLAVGVLGSLGGWIAEQGGAPGLGLGERALCLLTHDLPGLGSFREDVAGIGGVVGGLTWGRAWLAAGLGAVVLGLRSRGDRPEIAAAAMWVLGAHLVAALGSGRDLGEFRYLAPLWPYAVLLASLAPGRLAAGACAVAVLLVLPHHGKSLGEVDSRGLRAEAGLAGAELRAHEFLAEAVRRATPQQRAAWGARDRGAVQELGGEVGDGGSDRAREGRGGAIARRVHELGMSGVVDALGAPGEAGTGAFWRHVGAGAELGRQVVVASAAELSLPEQPDGLCVGLGIWAVQQRRQPGLRAVCGEGPAAVGRGLGAARVSLARGERPPLDLWLERTPTSREITGYRCGWAVGRGERRLGDCL